MEQPVRRTEHTVTVAAPAETVYGFIAEVDNWPSLFPPTVHVECLERDGGDERIRIWATANGEPKTWTSRRVLDPAALRVEFRQESSAPPVAAMGGAWVFEPLSPGKCRVRLLHDYRAADDDPEALEWIDRAVERNSSAELAALKENAERAAGGAADLFLSFEDTVRVAGSPEDVYDFLNEAALWEKRLPHVARVSLVEDVPGLQILEMDTRTKDGSVHTTSSVRVCLPHHKIVYKQTVLPALLDLHAGHWLIEQDGAETVVTAGHTVVINTAKIAKVLGPDAGVAEARDFVRAALSGNSGATLGHAREYAEERR